MLQTRLPWFGKLRELHGVHIGDDLEISFRARRGQRTVRIVPVAGGVKVISTLPDGLMAETFVAGLWSDAFGHGSIEPS